MGIPGGGRNQISMRFYRHFSICSMNTFSDETITQIFSTIISVSLMERNFPADFLTIGSQVVAATLDLYKSAIANLLPTPTKCHYVFSLRDFSRIIQGTLLIEQPRIDNKHIFIRLVNGTMGILLGSNDACFLIKLYVHTYNLISKTSINLNSEYRLYT